jgi:hypothetical protein
VAKNACTATWEFGMGAGDDATLGMPHLQQLSQDSGADHAAVACDVDFGLQTHSEPLLF